MFSLMNASSSACSVMLIGYTLPLSFQSCSLRGRRWISWSHGLRSGRVLKSSLSKTSVYSLYASGMVKSFLTRASVAISVDSVPVARMCCSPSRSSSRVRTLAAHSPGASLPVPLVVSHSGWHHPKTSFRWVKSMIGLCLASQSEPINMQWLNPRLRT